MRKIGFVAFGEVNTPMEAIDRITDRTRELLKNEGFNMVNGGIVTDDESGMDAARAVEKLKTEDFVMLVVVMTGWIPSHTVIRVISEFKHKPMILWGPAGKTVGGRLATTAPQAGTSAIRKPMEDLGFKFKYIYDFPDMEPRMGEIVRFIRSCNTMDYLKHSKVGMMGYRDMRLYGTMFDGVSLKKQLGVEVEFFEMYEIAKKAENVPDHVVDEKIREMFEKYNFLGKPETEALKKSVTLYFAIREKIEECGYDAVSLIDVDGMKKLMNLPPALIFLLIGDEMGKYTIPENDTLGAVTQLIMGNLTGQISPYMEFYEFFEGGVLMGVPDYVPSEVVMGKPQLLPTAFGKLSQGILNVSRVKTGRITLARLFESRGKYCMHVAAGVAKEPPHWEEVGWTPPAPQLPSIEVDLDGDCKKFTDNVMGQHYIITYGDNRDIIKDFCFISDIEYMEF